MGEFQIAITLLAFVAVILLVILAVCRFLGLWTWTAAWILSSREEKIGLTRAKGHYNANGYLVHSDSEIHLDASGNFKRFDIVDHDFRVPITTTSLNNQNQQDQQFSPPQSYNHQKVNFSGSGNNIAWGDSPPPGSPPAIPPQPLRPAPVPSTIPHPPPLPDKSDTSSTPLSTSLQHQVSTDRPQQTESATSSPTRRYFSVTATPPPSPATPALTSSRPGSTTTSTFTISNISSNNEKAPPIIPPISTESSSQISETHKETKKPASYFPEQILQPVIMPQVTENSSLLQMQLLNNALVQSHVQQNAPTGTVEDTENITDTLSSPALKRAMSCDSVCSDTSVVLGDLEEPNITGYLCIGLEYDNECCDLAVSILEAKDLIGPNQEMISMDTFVKLYLLPDKISSVQTKIYKNSNCPSFKERFIFPMNDARESMTKHSILMHVYGIDMSTHTLLGEAELKLADIALRGQPITTWITLTDTGQRSTEFGELLFSLSYLPTAERLTVVIVKARNLRFSVEKDSGDPFVKVYLLHNGKKVHKKKTSIKKGDRCPIFNEAMIFSVPMHTLQTIQLRVTVAENLAVESGSKTLSIGHVIVGAQASGRSLSHWNQMLSALRKPVAMWHPLRK